MTHFANGITLSGWILVAALNTGALWAEESIAVPTVPAADEAAAAPAGALQQGQDADSMAAAAAGAIADPTEQVQGLDVDLLVDNPDAGMSFADVATDLGLGLGLVILLAWGAVYLLRKSSVGQQFGGTGKMIRIAERSHISPKKAIYLVEIGDRILALGVTEENITALSEWQAGELELATEPVPVGSFAKQFKKMLKQDSQQEPNA